jgi:hypothetical protein
LAAGAPTGFAVGGALASLEAPDVAVAATAETAVGAAALAADGDKLAPVAEAATGAFDGGALAEAAARASSLRARGHSAMAAAATQARATPTPIATRRLPCMGRTIDPCCQEASVVGRAGSLTATRVGLSSSDGSAGAMRQTPRASATRLAAASA